MAPAAASTSGPSEQSGPHPSIIQVAKPYLFHQQLQGQLVATGANPTREDSYRLQGIQWIDDVRTGLQLPVRTFDTASVYFHKFRLQHKDNEYQYQDAAAAALLTACKVEDTLKKSREILCAAHNIRVAISEHLSPDDNVFDGPSKIVIGLERLMLEASGFDFRSRYPQKHLLKLAKDIGLERDTTKMAYQVMLDSYRTFSPLKHTSATLAFACIELSLLILDKSLDESLKDRARKYQMWKTTRAETLETMLDLLDLYTHFQKSSIIGPLFPMDTFIQIRIKLNQGVDDSKGLMRYTEHHEPSKTNGHKLKTPKTPITPASPSDIRLNGKDINSPATLSPRSSGSGRRGTVVRGQEGTVRFMLDADQAKKEKDSVAEYFKVEYEEYEVEVEEQVRPERNERERPRDYRNGDRPYHNNHYLGNKRIRR
ncbi:hypothetical protein BP6252_04235 [Coleophoma cylindrospora]|uniref:RNA polymerase II holoenzyme cyclin-like subunit n=1 Tax=Coleophoma cylindrospora TaxID=1849047 RepID=A0A3D8RZW6_9HELO|nr:hypothetical protein BP6252_04235 [Coleophoma cylindrospora]